MSGCNSTVSPGASASTQKALDTEQGETKLLGKAEGVAPKTGWKTQRWEEKQGA